VDAVPGETWNGSRLEGEPTEMHSSARVLKAPLWLTRLGGTKSDKHLRHSGSNCTPGGISPYAVGSGFESRPGEAPVLTGFS
jgi:hypothetical protein